MQLDKENNLSQQQFNELERTYQEQLKLVEREKNKHLECNIIDREKFDNIYTDLKGKLENKNEALEIEIKAKIQDNRVLAEELYKYKERNADNESKLDFQNKSVSRLQEENQWNLKELEKVKMEFSKYRNSKDKYCNDLEITNEKLSKENESLRKESKSLTIKNDNLNKEQKKLEDNKGKVSKFVNEVVSINEALVNKVNLLQEKERSRLKDKDNSLKNLVKSNSNVNNNYMPRGMSNSSSRAMSPQRQTPDKSRNRNMFDDMEINKVNDRTNTHMNKYNNRALNMNVITKEVEKQKKFADVQLKKTPKGSTRKELV